MVTRRQFIATTAATAVTTSVLQSTRMMEDPTTARGWNDERGRQTRGPVGELKSYNTLAASAQSVPFPEA